MGQLSRAGGGKCCWGHPEPCFGVRTVLFALSGLWGGSEQLGCSSDRNEDRLKQDKQCVCQHQGEHKGLREAEALFLEQWKAFKDHFLISLTAGSHSLLLFLCVPFPKVP